MRVILVLLLCILGASGDEVRPALDAARLQIGVFRYRDLVGNKEVGQGQIEIRKSGENYIFSNLIRGAFSQSWESVATRDFMPISAKLTFGEGQQAKPAFELVYAERQVRGFAVSKGERRDVDANVPGDTVDQRIDWAAVMSLDDYTAGKEFEFHVYDPGTGISQVKVRVTEIEMTKVPAGLFETVRVTYRIEKPGGPETYVVHVSKKTPRFLVREDFPNGAVSELVEKT
jgi:hypothetical protein